ncbi:MAG: glycosyltransferase family 2 protein [Deltaproteobacteria bacterium]|nr:glycosyltransferase family 2 protein [Deltaproteobacteria bacterium]
MTPRVSVVIPAYNAARWLAAAVESCLTQSFQALEIIIVDDGSNDATKSLVAQWGAPVRVVHMEHRGSSAARNVGTALARGEFIQYLDADDYLLPDKIGRQIGCLECSGAEVAYGDWRYRFEFPGGWHLWSPIVHPGQLQDPLSACIRNWWAGLGAFLFQRQAVLRAGGWDEEVDVLNDRDLCLRLAAGGARFVYRSGCGFVYRRYGYDTLSTRHMICKERRRSFLAAHVAILEKLEAALVSSEKSASAVDAGLQFRPAVRQALVDMYVSIAAAFRPLDSGEYDKLRAKAHALSLVPVPAEGRCKRLISRMLGDQGAAVVAQRQWEVQRALRLVLHWVGLAMVADWVEAGLGRRSTL